MTVTIRRIIIDQELQYNHAEKIPQIVDLAKFRKIEVITKNRKQISRMSESQAQDQVSLHLVTMPSDFVSL